HAYGTTYSGPIGSVISPHLKGMEEYGHLSHSSSLCGACTASCPLNIGIHSMLPANRKRGVESGPRPISDSIGWKVWKKSMESRRLLNMASASTKKRVFSALFSRSWGYQRTMVSFAPKSFNQLWKEKEKASSHGSGKTGNI